MAGSPTPRERAAQTAQAFIDAAVARARRLDAAVPSLTPERRASIAEIVRGGIVPRTAETWKYTPIAPFLSAPFATLDGPTGESSRTPDFLDFASATPISMRGARLDGTATVAAGVSLTTLAAGARGVPINPSIDLERHPLAFVNTALLEDALVLRVADGVDAGTLDLRFASAAAPTNVSRVRVELGAGSRLRLIEQHNEDRPTNSIVDVQIGEHAVLEHLRLLPRSDVASWCLLSVRVAADAAFELDGHALGGLPRRNDIHVRLDGARARTRIDLAAATYAKDRLDQHVAVEHIGIDTTCRETVHGIAAAASELTFDGRIHIHPGAQRSDARLTNRNLLLDRTARINTKPELEIYANDVKCSHGATVGQLDPQQLFYLRSRGLDEGAARAVLTRAFLTGRLSESMHDAGVLRLYAGLLAS